MGGNRRGTGGGSGDEMKLERNAGLIMGVSVQTNDLVLTADSSLDEQQQYCLQEKCGETLLATATFLSIFCSKAAKEITSHQQRLLASDASGRIHRP